MLRWRAHQNFTQEIFNKHSYRLGTWMYLSFVLGLTSRVLGIKPTKLSVVGVEFAIGNQDVVPGFFFLLTISLTLLIVLYGVFFVFHLDVRDYGIIRIFIYRVAATKKKVNGKTIYVRSLKDKDPIILKKIVRAVLGSYMLFQAGIFLTPSLFVIFYERSAVASAWKLFLH